MEVFLKNIFDNNAWETVKTVRVVDKFALSRHAPACITIVFAKDQM